MPARGPQAVAVQGDDGCGNRHGWRGLGGEVAAEVPEVGEAALGEGGHEVADALAAAGAALEADHALDHLDVVHAPESEPLVELEQRLGEVDEGVVALEIG